MPSTRRLTAILAADVAGYARLMGADEEGTHERLKAHLRELADPKIKDHRGRTVKNTGDGMLVEFPSVVDAVRSGVEVQRGMIVEEHDILGGGGTVAARLEALAEPDGICVSRVVHDEVRDKLDLAFED